MFTYFKNAKTVKRTLKIQINTILFLLAKSFLFIKSYTKIFNLSEDKATSMVTSHIPQIIGKYFNNQLMLLTIINFTVTQVYFLKHDFYFWYK